MLNLCQEKSMNRDELYNILTGSQSPLDTAQWLRQHYFPEIVSRFNNENSRKRFGLYQDEKIPANERNLTDVRTRMGVLIEFELARISNELLPELGINDIFWSYVVANRFPDLEIRKNSGERLLRLEIKCLQCVAEEKSANYDTLKKDIDPTTDYVIVCLWDWSASPSNIYQWDSVPVIYKVYVFHAYSLTMLRDTYWLNKPPANLNGGYQGFDVRYAVTCANNVYSKEQGNYGKLTRIWKEGFEFRPNDTPELLDTEQEYIVFQKEIVRAGFDIIAKNQLHSITGQNATPIKDSGIEIGYEAQKIAYLISSYVNQRKINALASSRHYEYIITMTEKYKSTIFHVETDAPVKIASNEKPKAVPEIILNHL